MWASDGSSLTNMKLGLLLLLLAGVCSGEIEEKGMFDGVKVVTTTDGKVYAGVKSVKVTPAYVTVIHEGGVGRVFWEKLPEDLRTGYGYDREAAIAFMRAENAKESATRAQLDKGLAVLKKRQDAEAAERERARRDKALFAELQAINDRYSFPSRPAPCIPSARPNGVGYRYYTTADGKGIWLRPEE